MEKYAMMQKWERDLEAKMEDKKKWIEPKLEKGENFSFVNVTAMSYGLPDGPADPPKKYHRKHHHHGD